MRIVTRIASAHAAFRTSPGGRSAALRARAPLALALVAVGFAACSDDAPSPTALGPQQRIEPVGRPAVVRGLYVNARAAGSAERVAELISLAEDSPVNTFVVDVKERGEVSYASSVPLATEAGAIRDYIEDPTALLATLREHGIYPVARIVCFRDAVLAEARPDLAVRDTAGGVWLDPESGKPWVDPYHPEVRAYNIALAREALDAGFAEVQWDYVRFPDVTAEERGRMVFPSRAGRTRSEGIESFIEESREALGDFDAPITADVFGRVITTRDDSGIGQDWNGLVRVTDVLLPMVYPSLYWPGSLGIEDPAREPYGIVRAALDSAVTRLDRTDGARATLRPWLQAFSLDGVTYGAEEIRAQIRAADDVGLQEWFLWHPESEYPPALF